MSLTLPAVTYYDENSVYHYTEDNAPLQQLASRDDALNAALFAHSAQAAVTLYSTDVVANPATGQTPTQYLSHEGIVSLSGQLTMTTGSLTSGSTLFTLSPAYVPNRTVSCLAVALPGGPCVVTITSAGNVSASITLTTSTFLSLDGISYILQN